MRILSKTSLCSSLAIATAMIVGARPAAAQVAGTGSFAAGSGTINTSTGNVTLTGTQRYVIDWNATGSVSNGVNNFLPSGNQMNFSSGSDFAVLNRVSTGADMLGLNGSITSTVNGVNGRGTVFFYNPNGIVVGGSAMIDVGSLGLTTADPVPLVGPASNWFQGFNAASPTLTFNPASSGSQIRIDPNAQLASNGTNNFVAIVAPKISMSGTIKSDGDVALVAAEAATLSFSDTYDLYGIQVDLGTDVADSLTVDGGTIARNSAVETSGIARNAYLVAVPKNDATTLLITGGASLGFDVASSAVVEGNSVILSAGRDLALFGNQTANGSIRIENATLSSAVDAFATNSIVVNPTLGDANFLSSLEITAGSLVDLDASSRNISVGGFLSADVSQSVGSGINGLGGTILLTAGLGQTLSVAGAATLDASADGGFAVDNGFDGGTAQGGTVTITADGGTVQAGAFDIDVSALGGGAYGGAAGGAAYGGTASLTASNNGSIAASSLSIDATAEGGTTSECLSCSVTGGYGEGGTILLSLNDSSLLLSPSSFNEIYAFGQGGAGDVAGGVGQGGTITLTLAGDSTLGLGNGYMFADGVGGTGLQDGDGGAGFGGIATYSSMTVGGIAPTAAFSDFDLTIDGVGGNAQGAGNGGSGTGGTFDFTMDGGSLTARSILLGGIGRGGASTGGIAGEAVGSDTSFTLTGGGSVSTQGAMYVRSDAILPSAQSGDPLNGALARGGTTQFTVDQGQITTNVGGIAGSGSLFVSAAAKAANGAGGDGGVAIGGDVIVSLSGATISGAAMSFDASAAGGSGADGSGGDAYGGTVAVSIANSNVNAGAMTLTGNSTAGTGTAGGGVAAGSAVDLSVSNSTLMVNGILTIDGKALAGAGIGTESGGGAATGANVSALFDDSGVTTTGRIDISSEATGGASNGSYDGGDGTGGTASLAAIGGSIVSTNNTWVISYGTGGSANCFACDATGGDGTGGAAAITLSGAGTTYGITNTLQLYSSGNGGNGTGDASGGNGWAAPATLTVGGGTTLNVKNAYVFADGLGGNAEGLGDGGDGHGSIAALLGDDVAGGTINQSGGTYFHITAEGFTGNPSTGVGGAVDGDAGSAFGGEAIVNANGLQFNGNALWVSAYASAGNSLTGAGGNATGGTASVQLTNGANFNVAQTVTLNTYANAGDGASGGSALSGNSELSLNNASMVTGTALAADAYSVVLASYAFGGSGADGDGGSATSGDANLLVGTGGSLTAKSLHVSTGAQGGNSDGGTRAGDADGGFAMVRAENGGTIAVAGGAKIRALAVGGVGTGGADGGDASADALALLNSVGGGSVSIAGDLEINTDRAGGDGHNGGDALAIINYQTPTVGQTFPVSEIFSNGGSVAVGGITTLSSNAVGGNGEYGGNGGDAYGGTVSIRAVNGAAGPSAVTLGDVSMTATSTAGNGGDGISSEIGDGGNGGDGGDVLAGMIFIQAMSLNGQVSTGDLTLATTSQAGSGGWGGSGINGGNGGQGGSVIGNWSAGAINLSLPSGGNPPGLPLVTNGFEHFGTIVADTSATGGNGGWGGWAYDGANGTAGNGGSAQSGDFYIINRGGDFAAGDFTWTFDATGGAAGSNPNETPAGIGGDASTGQFLLINSNRSGQIDQRGTMSFGNVMAVAASTGGSGLVDGHSYHASNLDFEAVNADTHLGSFTYAVDATDGPVIDTYDFTSQIVVDNGSILVDGDLSLTVPEGLAVWVNNGSLAANSITLDAANFVHAANRPYPATLGLVDTGGLYITTGQDIVIDANIDVGGALGFTAPGSVSIGSATSGDGDISIYADGGFVLTSALDAAGGVTIHAGGDIDTSDITGFGDIDLMGAGISTGSVAGSTVTMIASQDLNAGDITSDGDMMLSAGGNLGAGSLFSGYGSIVGYAGQGLAIADADAGFNLDLTAANGNLTIANYSQAYGDIDLTASGLIQTADLSAEGDISAVGGAIDVGNLVAGASLGGGIGTFALGAGDIGLWSGSTIDAGNLTAGSRIGVAAPGAINVGAITAGDLVMLLGGSSISTGAILADGELYIGGYDMFALGYDPQTDDFDPTPVLAQAPTATGGSLTVAGSVDATQVHAGVGSWSSGTITAFDGPVVLTANGTLSATDIAAAGAIELYAVNGAMTVGNVDSGDYAYLWALQGAITAGTVDAFANIVLRGQTGVSTGALSAETSIALLRSTNGAINVGGVSATAIDAQAGGAMTSTGALVSTGDIDLNAGGAVSITSASAAGTLGIISGGGVTATGALSGPNGLTVDAAGNVNLASIATNASFNVGGANVSIGSANGSYGTVDANGLLTVGGAWNVDSLFAISNDIAIGQGGSINGSFANLLSSNAVGAGIGDNSGAAAGSYVLDNGELSRIGSQTLLVYAGANASDIDLKIGNTTLAGGGRNYDFGVIDSQLGYNFEGRLRVTGKITGQNFTNNDQLDLDAQTIEIDAVNGGIDFSPNSDATVGSLFLGGQHIAIAEASVLDKLNADTQYAGRDLDLATAPTANHSDTTINVGTINVYLFDPSNVGGLAVPAAAPTYTIYNQNMSSTNVRSGLLIADANLYGDIAPGSVEMILNGKLVDPESGQTLQGAAVRDAFVADPENDLTLFTASSSINGCSLAGNGCFTPQPPAPPPTPQVEDLANQFVFLDNSVGDQLGFGDDMDSGDGDSDDEDGDKTEEKNAIDPPPSLINGKPLDPQTPTDEPVSGTGNPALIGTGSSQQEQQ